MAVYIESRFSCTPVVIQCTGRYMGSLHLLCLNSVSSRLNFMTEVFMFYVCFSRTKLKCLRPSLKRKFLKKTKVTNTFKGHFCFYRPYSKTQQFTESRKSNWQCVVLPARNRCLQQKSNFHLSIVSQPLIVFPSNVSFFLCSIVSGLVVVLPSFAFSHSFFSVPPRHDNWWCRQHC
jgi:hypothetical protein